MESVSEESMSRAERSLALPCVSAAPVVLPLPFQTGTAGQGENAAPLLSPGSFCHIWMGFLSVVLHTDCRRERAQEQPWLVWRSLDLVGFFELREFSCFPADTREK